MTFKRAGKNIKWIHSDISVIRASYKWADQNSRKQTEAQGKKEIHFNHGKK